VPAGAKGSLRGKKVTMPWPGTKPAAVGGTKKSDEELGWLNNTGPLGHLAFFSYISTGALWLCQQYE